MYTGEERGSSRPASSGRSLGIRRQFQHILEKKNCVCNKYVLVVSSHDASFFRRYANVCSLAIPIPNKAQKRMIETKKGREKD